MKVSLNWLNEYVDVPQELQEFCDKLDLTGTGVEDVETLGDTFDNIVTAKVISKKPHPDSDHMWVCQVDVGMHNTDDAGSPEPLQIVCGAQNFNEGDHIVTALVGAELPGDIKIKKSKLRGVVSCGMNCSARELGLGNDHDGIMILPEDAPVGIPFSEYFNNTDTVLDLEITPNRPDCLSITGFAREVGAIYGNDWRDPLPEMASKMVVSNTAKSIEDMASITIEDPVRCPRYSARIIEGVKIGPSPDWMVERLAAIGQRSVNNIVDVTNYILFLFGQPLHSFDYDKLVGPDGKANIVIRAAEDGEKLQTLDGVERTLDSDMTVIATKDAGAVALAGVMGGMDTEITDATTNIFLEAATFEAGRTSRTSRNLGLISESSMRYERGVDDWGVDVRSEAACALILEVAGGQVVRSANNDKGILDQWPLKSEAPNLIFRIDRFNAMMGADIPESFIVDTLVRLGCAVNSRDDANGILNVEAPTFRPDLIREIDLYEEVLRIWGMDRIEPTLPSSAKRVGKIIRSDEVKRAINDTLRASGLNETMTYSFAALDDMEKLNMPVDEGSLPVELLNPLNVDQPIMRRSIIPGLLRSVAYNQSRSVDNVSLYEIGSVFNAHEGHKKPKEKVKVGAVMAGAMKDGSWNTDYQAFDFFDGKGAIENLIREMALPKPRFIALSAEEAPHLQPGRAAKVMSGGTYLGWVGELHPKSVAAFDAVAPVVAFELDVDALDKSMQMSRPYVEIPEYPAIEVDQNFVVSEDVTNEKLVQVITSAGGKLLEDVVLFDVYRDDERVGKNKKSMAYKLIYRAPERTLTSEEVDKVHQKLVKKVAGATGAEVRA